MTSVAIERPNITNRALVPIYVATMLLSACLLFLVQPMFARMALPLLGGTPAVWAIAMCFFQGALLGGYAYAHVLKTYTGPRVAVMVHMALMAGAWFFLPVHIEAEALPHDGAAAGVWLVWLMAKAIGYPFFFLSATAPLLQSWFARTTHKDASNPYFLYSASNIGSIGALVFYPFLIEPNMGLRMQAAWWSIGYGALMLGIVLCGIAMLRDFNAPQASAKVGGGETVLLQRKVWWVMMAFVPSALLVAWTNHITTDIASAPFLWLPPLVLFLLTFVLVFRDKPLVPLWLARWAQLLSLPICLTVNFALPLGLAVWVILAGAIFFFSSAIICHRQLYEARPDASHLTEFYMLMSLGGVLGGLFVSLLAPLMFNMVAEYPLLMLAAVACWRGLYSGSPILGLLKPSSLVQSSVVATMCALLISVTHFAAFAPHRLQLRNYFGEISIEDGNSSEPYRFFMHGTTMHGAERLDELSDGFTGIPHALTYYSPPGGMARALLATQERLASLRRTGTYRIIGLGTGSLACYARPGENWAYYEVDPNVTKVARDPRQFTFLSRCAPDMKVIDGDARLTLAQEAGEKADYLLIDAFSSDSIPMHLMTTEAMKLYLARVKDDGVIVIHITNRYMDLSPVIAANLKAIDPTLQGRVMDYVPDRPDLPAMHSIVIAISRNGQVLAQLGQSGVLAPLNTIAGVDPWTDDFANLPAAMLRRIAVTKY